MRLAEWAEKAWLADSEKDCFTDSEKVLDAEMEVEEFEKVIDALYDGPEAAIKDLLDQGLKYRYFDYEKPEFVVAFEDLKAYMHGCSYQPLCVDLFGSEQNMERKPGSTE